jgi:hypothetical protein
MLKAFYKQTTNTVFKQISHFNRYFNNKLIYSFSFNKKYTPQYLFSNKTINSNVLFKQFEPKIKDSDARYYYKEGKNLLENKKY